MFGRRKNAQRIAFRIAVRRQNLLWQPAPTEKARTYNAENKKKGIRLLPGPSNQPGDDASQPLLSGLVAVACALLLVATGALLVLAVFRPRRQPPTHGDDPAPATSLLADDAVTPKAAPSTTRPSQKAADDADPDVIPLGKRDKGMYSHTVGTGLRVRRQELLSA